MPRLFLRWFLGGIRTSGAVLWAAKGLKWCYSNWQSSSSSHQMHMLANTRTPYKAGKHSHTIQGWHPSTPQSITSTRSSKTNFHPFAELLLAVTTFIWTDSPVQTRTMQRSDICQWFYQWTNTWTFFFLSFFSSSLNCCNSLILQGTNC